MRPALLITLSSIAFAQTIPTRLGDSINLIPPACSPNGRAVLFAAATSPDARAQKGTNLYLYTQGAAAGAIKQLTNYAGDTPNTGVTSVTYGGTSGFAGFTALPAGPGGAEEVHLLNLTTTVDRTLVSDKEGCPQLLACVNCFRTCIGPVHLNADASMVLYATAAQQPFRRINADGSGLTQLPVYSGSLAPSPQRVISRAGVVVFTSSAPSGPTFAAAATDVYTINLDGTNLQQVTKFGNANFYAANATISADGTLIAFESNLSASGPQNVNAIFVVRPDGTGLRKLSTGADPASSPSISGDGSAVSLVQSGQVKRAFTADGSILDLTKLFISVPHDAVLSEDGALAAFTLSSQFGNPAAIEQTPANTTKDLRDFTTIYAPRLLSENGVASATGYASPSPGSLITAYGVNLALDELTQAKAFPLPTVLGDLSLLVNNDPIPLVATTPWQINAQLPPSVPVGTSVAQLRYSDGVSLQLLGFKTDSPSPSNFAYPYTRGNLGYQQAAAYHAGTAIAADLDHPAAAGETLEVYGEGLGRTDPVVTAGLASPSSPLARAVQTPRIQIGGRDAVVTFAGLTPGLAGVFQVNVIVPSGLAAGVQSLAWIDSSNTSIYSSIAVK